MEVIGQREGTMMRGAVDAVKDLVVKHGVHGWVGQEGKDFEK